MQAGLKCLHCLGPSTKGILERLSILSQGFRETRTLLWEGGPDVLSEVTKVYTYQSVTSFVLEKLIFKYQFCCVLAV